jgi:hypothetical protein
MATTPFKLSPSDLTFLWDECKRCFYLKVAAEYPRPAAAFPSIFSKIDGLMKHYFEGKATAEISPSLPPGFVMHGEKWVQSLPITFPDRAAECYLRGKFDTVLQFKDGSYGVVDFKTSSPKPSHLAFYGRQLHAYAYALEHAAQGKFSLSPITRLGLLVVEPNAIEKTPAGSIAYAGYMTWQEIPYDEAAFLVFLEEVVKVLEQPEPPEAAANCTWCQYRQAARERQV